MSAGAVAALRSGRSPATSSISLVSAYWFRGWRTTTWLIPGAMITNGTCSVVSPSSNTTTIASRPDRQSGPDWRTGIHARSQASAWASVPSWPSWIRFGVTSPTLGSRPDRVRLQPTGPRRAGGDVPRPADGRLAGEVRPRVVVDVVVAAVAAVARRRHRLLVRAGGPPGRDRLPEDRRARIVAAASGEAVLRLAERGAAEDRQVVRQARVADVAPVGGPAEPGGQAPQVGHPGGKTWPRLWFSSMITRIFETRPARCEPGRVRDGRGVPVAAEREGEDAGRAEGVPGDGDVPADSGVPRDADVAGRPAEAGWDGWPQPAASAHEPSAQELSASAASRSRPHVARVRFSIPPSLGNRSGRPTHKYYVGNARQLADARNRPATYRDCPSRGEGGRSGMEASEAVRRIFWRHRWLIVVLTLVPVMLVAPWRLAQPVTYAATADVQAQAAAPDADTQVLATSPQLVGSAITQAKAGRNPLYVARHEVSATSLGSSAVVAVTVTDPSRPVAVRLARSLAALIVTALNTVGEQPSAELATLSRQRAQLVAARDSLVSKLAKAQARNESATSAAVQGLITQLAGVEAQLSANQAAVQQILSASSANQGAGILADPSTAKATSRHVAVYSALAALLGLVIALLIATIRELVRPTIGGPAAGARELSLVLLGSASTGGGERPMTDPELPLRLDLAAQRLDARTLVLTGPVPAAQLSILAAHLDGMVPAIHRPSGGNGAGPAGSRLSGVTALTAFSPAADGSRGDAEPNGASHGQPGSLTVTALSDLTLRSCPASPALVLVLPAF